MAGSSTDDDSGGVILDGPFDPDAQATVSDYVDYTEYLPADLVRSLTLIRGLDERYLESSQVVHELTKTYGQLPNIPLDTRPSAQVLRKDISKYLDRAINARESAYGEACRLYDVVDRHFDRLGCVKQKLRAHPQPVPREPSAVREQVPAADNKRARTGKKGEGGRTTRITLRLDNNSSNRREGPLDVTRKSRNRRPAIAEHLVGIHPDSPVASTEQSDAEAEPKVVRGPEAVAESPMLGTEKKRSRQTPGTNAHSSVAGISTSNALALLKPPPEGAQPGSKDLPWLRLTEWEMTKLRKKMKKNAVWQPSEVMVHRELALRGRGWEAYRAAKADAEAAGAQFVDCDDITNTYAQGKLTRKSDATKTSSTAAETKLSNRGMKLNEAKKLKREHQARELAAAAAGGVQGPGEHGSTITSVLPGFEPAVSPETSASSSKGKARPTRKRKVEEFAETVTQPHTEAITSSSNLRTSTRRRKGRGGALLPSEAGASISTDSVGADATNMLSDNMKRSSRLLSPTGAAPAASRTRETSTTRPSSRLRSTAASLTEPSRTTAAGRDLRRKSVTPAKRTSAHEISQAPNVSAIGGVGPGNKRRRRPAPGPISSGEDGGAAVSYGRRKAKPAKKRIGTGSGTREQGGTAVAATGGVTGRSQKESSTAANQDTRLDEDGVLEEIDPNEPRYCICGDISFGTMICCENPDCDREWFHLDCVGLTEVPGRTAKWYCPECRLNLNKGSDGIVRTTGSRRAM